MIPFSRQRIVSTTGEFAWQENRPDRRDDELLQFLNIQWIARLVGHPAGPRIFFYHRKNREDFDKLTSPKTG
jgi:hypothetical protein